MATHFAIISRGELKFEGTAEALRAQSRPSVVVEVNQPNRAYELLRSLGVAVTVEGARIGVVPNETTGRAEINRLLVQSGVEGSHLTMQHLTLENMFLEFTAHRRQKNITMLRRALTAEALK